MKKLSIIVILALVCALCFAGCGEKPTSTLDLSECEIGYEFEVYPNVEFDYKINDDFIVHISDIKVTLIEKNEVNTNDILEGEFYPYVAKIEVTGTADPKFSGTSIYISFSNGSNTPSCKATITEDGTFHARNETSVLKKYDTIYLYRIIISK